MLRLCSAAHGCAQWDVAHQELRTLCLARPSSELSWALYSAIAGRSRARGYDERWLLRLLTRESSTSPLIAVAVAHHFLGSGVIQSIGRDGEEIGLIERRGRGIGNADPQPLAVNLIARRHADRLGDRLTITVELREPIGGDRTIANGQVERELGRPISAAGVAQAMRREEIHPDVHALFERICASASLEPPDALAAHRPPPASRVTNSGTTD